MSILERSSEAMKQYISDLESENNQLRDQLSSALEHSTTKSSGRSSDAKMSFGISILMLYRVLPKK